MHSFVILLKCVVDTNPNEPGFSHKALNADGGYNTTPFSNQPQQQRQETTINMGSNV